MDIFLNFNFNFCVLLITAVFFLGCSYEKTELTLGSAFDKTWEFSNQNSYEFDDNLVEIVGGKAKLKAIDLNDTTNDLNLGSHNGTLFEANQLTLSTGIVFDENHVNEVLPSMATHLVGYWRFENSLADLSGQNNNGSLNGDLAFATPGKNGQHHISLDGDGDYIEVANNTSLQTNAMTISIWAKLTGNDRSIITKGTSRSAASARDWDLFGNGTDLRFLIGDGTATQIAVTSNNGFPSLNEWHHFVVTWDGTTGLDGVKFYVDGVLWSTGTATSTNNSNLYPLYIGGYRPSGSYEHSGGIDELAIWNKAITEQQVKNLYSYQATTYFNELSPLWTPRWNQVVGYWKMDESWQDSSPNNNHGTEQAGASLVSSAQIGDGSGEFDGVSGRALIDDDPSISGLSAMSFSLWVNFHNIVTPSSSDPNVIETIFIKGNNPLSGAGVTEYAFYYDPRTGQDKVTLYLSGTSVRIASIPNAEQTFANNKWYHLAGSWTDGSLKLFLNGQQVTLNTNPLTSLNDLSSELRIGGGLSARRFDGLIDDFALWNTNLTNAEILQIYDRQKQKYSGHYDSQVFDLGSSTASWPDLSWQTSLPFFKEIIGDYNGDSNVDSENSSSYSGITTNLNSGLIGYWNLNERTITGVVGEVKDLSGKNMDGQMVGTVSPDKGRFENAVVFPGASNHIEIPPQAGANNLTEFTTSAWIFLEQNGQSYYGVFNKDGIWTQGMHIGAARSLRAYKGFSTTGAFSETNANVIIPNTWHHIVAVFNQSGSNGFKLYIDGKDMPITGTQAFGVGTAIDYSANNFTIGSNELTRSFSGKIDEVALWNRALTSLEVRELYQRGSNRVKLQVRSCADKTCQCESYSVAPTGSATDCDGDGTSNDFDSDDNYKAKFIGPGGDGTTYYSELYNRNPVDVNFSCALNITDGDAGICARDEVVLNEGANPLRPEFYNSTYTQFVTPVNNRYVQYRVYLEADENDACSGSPCLPNLTGTNLNPSNQTIFASEYVEITPRSPIVFNQLKSIKIKANDCATFRLSRLATDYYHDGVFWMVATLPAHRNVASEVIDHIQQFALQMGAGELLVKSYLNSGMTQLSQCEIDEIDVDYN